MQTTSKRYCRACEQLRVFEFIRAIGHSRCSVCGGFYAFRKVPEKIICPKNFDSELKLRENLKSHIDSLNSELIVAQVLYSRLCEGMSLSKLRQWLLKRKESNQLRKGELAALEWVEELLSNE